jgi:hypothetical protein
VSREADIGSIGQTLMRILEGQPGVARLSPHGRLLLAPAALGLLDVGEVGVDTPSDVEFERFPRRVHDGGAHLERRDAHAIAQLDIQPALRQPALVSRLVVSRLAAAAISGDLRKCVREFEKARIRGGRLAKP